MPERPAIVYLVSHTHWDREWYLTAHEFQVDLERVVEGVLDRLDAGGEFKHFALDGQTIALEDYLSVRPEHAPRVAALCREGRLALGPWYVLPDEFLVSGESMVRNLLIGHAVAAPFGGAQKVGLMPDSFGHLAQMPQLLRGAGIDSFIYTRGNDDAAAAQGLEFDWTAPDGSRVLAVNQCRGYCNAGGLGFQEIWHAHTRRRVEPARAVEQVRELFIEMARHSRSDVWLLNNGCDHFPVQQDFEAVLAALRDAFPETEFRHGSYGGFLAALRSRPFAPGAHAGELLGGKEHHILSGVWSARMPLKQANERCQHLLARVLEPASAVAHFVHGSTYPAGAIGAAWKLLLANHPHDSICGCSTDDVHAEMLPRFAGVRETATRLLQRQLGDLAPRFGPAPADDRATVLTLFNPLPVPRREIVERLVVLQPFGYRLDTLGLVDADGNAVPCEIVSRQFVERFWGIDYRAALTAEEQLARFAIYREQFGERILHPDSEADTADCFLHLRFEAALPALGHATFTLVEDAPTPPPFAHPVRVAGSTLENGLVRVALHSDGRLDLDDLRDGRSFHGLNHLVDDEDAGDEYDFSHAATPRTVSAAGLAGEVVHVDAGAGRATVEARFNWLLPVSLGADRSARSPETVDCPVAVRVTLTAGSPLVDVRTRIDNRAEDHRLRAEFPAGIVTDRVLSEGHYFINARPLTPPTGEDWVQPHPGSYPQQDYSLLQAADGGLAVLNRGLPEIHPLPADGGLSLTLLRAVGWLSRDDFVSRRCSNAGPTLATPDAQCLGPQELRYALLPFAGHHLQADVKGVSETWRAEPLGSQGVAAGLRAGGPGLFAKTNPHVAVSAIKRCEARDTLIVRLWNLSGDAQVERLVFGPPPRAAWRVNLLEERQEAIALGEGRALELPLGGQAIVSVEFELGVE